MIQPKSRVITRKWGHHPIEGSEKRFVPKWIKRKDLNHFVRYHSDRGHIPIDNFKKEIRIISYAGKRLTRTQIDDLFKHAAVWQKLLLKEKSVRGTHTSDSNNLARYKEHGKSFRNTSSNSKNDTQHVLHF